MLRGPDFSRFVGQGTLGGTTLLEQAGAQLHAQYPSDGIIDPRHRNIARAYLSDRVLEECLPLLGHHDYLDARIDSLGATVLRASLHLINTIPVADDHSVDPHAALED